LESITEGTEGPHSPPSSTADAKTEKTSKSIYTTPPPSVTNLPQTPEPVFHDAAAETSGETGHPQHAQLANEEAASTPSVALTSPSSEGHAGAPAVAAEDEGTEMIAAAADGASTAPSSS
jgi:hypothetical protein